jgi:intracellular sulfur oxidation DsrE/DsrF family protein
LIHLKFSGIERSKVKTLPTDGMDMDFQHAIACAPRRARGAKPERNFRCIAAAVLLACTAVQASAANAQEGGVYISGQGASFDQAVEQALAERSRQNARFWIVVSGSEVGKLTRSPVNAEVAERIRELRELGGVIYACESDLERQAISEDELLDGVERVAGYGAAKPGFPVAQAENGLPASVPQTRLILRSCAEDAPAQ